MEKRLIIALLLMPFLVAAQSPYGKKVITDRSGLVRSGLGLKLGTNGTFSSFAASGDLAFYIDPKISIEGEGNYHLGVLGELTAYDVVNHHSLLAGANYHFIAFKGFDPYLGLKVGAGFTEVDVMNQNLDTSHDEDVSVDPLAGVQLGFNYYTGAYFHMFMEAGYLMHKHNTAINPSLTLNEFSFKFGLGLHFDRFCK